MAGAITQIVSKRLLRPAMVVLCLLAAQMVLSLASCAAEPSPMAAKVALGR